MCVVSPRRQEREGGKRKKEESERDEKRGGEGQREEEKRGDGCGGCGEGQVFNTPAARCVFDISLEHELGNEREVV